MIEMLHAETIKGLLHDDDPRRQPIGRVASAGAEGSGRDRGPRGTLPPIPGRRRRPVTMANLIVSTTNNNQAMNTAVREVAWQYLHGQEITEGLLNHIEVAIRAFDPACPAPPTRSRQMPPEVTPVDAEWATEPDRKYKA